MKISDLKEQIGAEVLTEIFEDRDIKDCLICDLLSLVMAKGKKDDLWITVQTNINVLAVAHLTDASAVLIAEDMTVPESTVEKAREEKICILRSPLDAFSLSVKIKEML